MRHNARADIHERWSALRQICVFLTAIWFVGKMRGNLCKIIYWLYIKLTLDLNSNKYNSFFYYLYNGSISPLIFFVCTPFTIHTSMSFRLTSANTVLLNILYYNLLHFVNSVIESIYIFVWIVARVCLYL